jgi:hypothetical protein
MKKEQSIQSVFNKLHKFSAKEEAKKVELSNVIKVEFSAIGDMASAAKLIKSLGPKAETNAYKLLDNYNKFKDQANQAVSKASDVRNDLAKIQNAAKSFEKAYNQVLAQAKELGINAIDIPNFKENLVWQEIKDATENIPDALSQIKPLK